MYQELFFQTVKEVVFKAAFMFELNLFEIFGSSYNILFYPLLVLQSGISNEICDLVL